MTDYSIVKQIGKGGMGCVYEAYSPTGNRVALKKLASTFAGNAEYRELFNSEVASLRMMNHPTVVGIKGDTFSDSDGNLYLPMEYIEGETLEKYVREHGPFNEQKAIELMCKIIDAFSYIHSCNCIHRDIKPSNIMLKRDGSICVIDFGIAKDMKMPTGKTIGRIIGTDGYMSPEQAKGDSIDSRTDIYSLGCLFYFLLCGKHAIKKETNDYQTICSILNEEFPSVRQNVPTISEQTEAVLKKAVDKNMLNRFKTAEAFKSALCSEQSEEKQTSVILKTVVTVGRKGCDINISNEYVSGKHLSLEYHQDNITNQQNSCLILIDSSSNGTSVDGKYLHREKMSIPFTLSKSSVLPEVYLAGRTECKLDWNEVIRFFTEREQLNAPLPEIAIPDPVVESEEKDKESNVGVIIFSFLFPLVGWITWGIYKKKNPKKASKAANAAWIGVATNLIATIIQLVI